jgi:putative Mg2+ transporter-C (MgtC) family protein
MDPYQTDFWIAVGVSFLCGAIIGVERQLRGKPAGIRTSILICLGTMLFVRLGNSIGSPSADPTRVLGQIVTGVGFIGAGVMLAREGLVHGVTSAAVIWILAGIGASVGFGKNGAAIVIALLVLMVLAGVERLENTVHDLRRGDYGKERAKQTTDRNQRV